MDLTSGGVVNYVKNSLRRLRQTNDDNDDEADAIELVNPLLSLYHLTNNNKNRTMTIPFNAVGDIYQKQKGKLLFRDELREIVRSNNVHRLKSLLFTERNFIGKICIPKFFMIFLEESILCNNSHMIEILVDALPGESKCSILTSDHHVKLLSVPNLELCDDKLVRLIVYIMKEVDYYHFDTTWQDLFDVAYQKGLQKCFTHLVEVACENINKDKTTKSDLFQLFEYLCYLPQSVKLFKSFIQTQAFSAEYFSINTEQRKYLLKGFIVGCSGGNIEVVELLWKWIKEIINPDIAVTTCEEGFWEACKHNCFEIVQWLSPIVNISKLEKSEVLYRGYYVATTNGCLEVIQHLSTVRDITSIPLDKKTNYSIFDTTFLTNQKYLLMKYIFSSRKDLLFNRKIEYLESILLRTSAAGDLEYIQYIFENYPEQLKLVCEEKKMEMLKLICETGNLNFIRYLVEEQSVWTIDMNIITNSNDKNQLSALVAAIACGFSSIVEYLFNNFKLEQVLINDRNKLSESLQAICSNFQYEILCFFVSRQIVNISQIPILKKCLYYCCTTSVFPAVLDKNNHQQVFTFLEYLTSHHEIDLNYPLLENSLNTPLYYAIIFSGNRYNPVLQFLFENNANVCVLNEDGITTYSLFFMDQYDELLPYFLHYYYCTGMIQNGETVDRNVAEYYPYIFQEEPSIVKYYIEYCNASVHFPWLRFVVTYPFCDIATIQYLELFNVTYIFEMIRNKSQDLIHAVNCIQNTEFVDYITQWTIDKKDEGLCARFIDLFLSLSSYESLLSSIKKLDIDYDRKFELCKMIVKRIERRYLLASLSDYALLLSTIEVVVIDYDQKLELCKMIVRNVEKEGSFNFEVFGITIKENSVSLSDDTEVVEKSKHLWKFIGLSCCLGFHGLYRMHFDEIIADHKRLNAPLSNLIAQCSLTGGTTIFMHYLRYMTSPIAFLNSIFAGGGKKDENVLYNIFHTQYLKNGNPFLLLHLVNLLRSLGTAAKKHPTEASDINDVIRKVEAMIAEVFSCNVFDDPKQVLRLLSPNAESILTGIETFSPNAVIPICLDCNITALFDKPQVNNIIQQLFYHRDGRFVDIRQFRRSPFSIYWNVVKKLNSDNDDGDTFLFDDDYFTASFWVRGSPMVNMFVDFVVKCVLLWLLATVVIYDYGAAFGIDYSTKVIADDDARYTILHSISNFELCLAVFSLADLLFEIGQFIEQDIKRWKEIIGYFTVSWNRLDMICAAGFVVWFFLRFTVSFEYFNVARVILTLNAIPLSVGLLRYVSVYQPLGELVILIRGMASQIISFFVVYAICILGFGITFYGLFYEVNDSYSTAGYTFLTLLQNTLVNFDFTVFQTNSNVVNILGMVLLTTFLIFTAIILMNLLIAQMSNTYQTIKEKATRKWSIGFAELVKDYVLIKERHVFCMLPPPLNIITIVIAPVHYYCVHHYKFSIGGTITNIVYDSIVGGLIRLPKQILSVVIYLKRLFMRRMKTLYKSKKLSKLKLATEIIPYFILTTLWILLSVVFHGFFMLLDIVWVPTCMIYYLIVTPICYFLGNYYESRYFPKVQNSMMENFYFFAVRLHQDGSIKRMYEEVEHDSNTEKSKHALPNFKDEEIQSILRPLKSYWKPVTNDDLSRLQHNMIHETKNLLDVGIREETNIPFVSVHELKDEIITELKAETMELKEKFAKLEENHEILVSMLKELLNKQHHMKSHE